MDSLEEDSEKEAASLVGEVYDGILPGNLQLIRSQLRSAFRVKSLHGPSVESDEWNSK